ncbi:type II toxin-antitoxin system RelB/DinJ family antitoxin [Aerococcaceae bacterium WS4759]|uniref:Type II toxin-antitoxin system RelB/DinJ family antitoxin n=1 Tax=Fundicoccus ignavus TaxID=2664442 RepID=A0A6I2GI12_9LACT|nr:type II toxin-antitoxin system RelB/DinJ family antitoxin [Fundicoccus ignavus]
MDETVKRQAIAVLNNLGMDASTAINVFLDRSLQKTVCHFNQNKLNSTLKPLQPLKNLITWSKMELVTSILLLTKFLKMF